MDYNVSLDEAISIALKNNAKMKISQTSIAIADTLYNQAYSAHYPTLDLSVNAFRMSQDSSFILKGDTTIDNTQSIAMNNALSQAAQADGNFDTAGTYANIAANTPAATTVPIEFDTKIMGRDSVVSQVSTVLPLYTGGKISAYVKQAEIGKRIAQESKRRSENEVIYDVKRYYYSVVLTKQLKKLSDDTMQRMYFIQDLTTQLYKGGSLNVKKTDYLRTKLGINIMESLNIEITTNETLAKSALLFAMGLTWSDTVDVIQEEIAVPKMDNSLELLVNNAYSFNPDYQTLKLAINVYDSKIDASQSDYLPSVGAYASAQNIYNSYEYGLINDDNKNSWTIGIGVEWSLFNGMRTSNEVEQNRLEKLQLQQQEVLLKEGLALQVKKEFLKIKSSYKKYKVLTQATQTAEENRDLNTRAYQEDMVDTKDVIESQLFESYTLGAYYTSMYKHALARAELDFIVGSAMSKALGN
jgi:outer membrane protein TolC